MRRTRSTPLAVAALCASVAAGLTGGAAHADPVVTPGPNDIVGVGSQTTGPLFNRFSTDYNAYLTSAGDTLSPRLYSWDATGPAPIVPRANADTIARPSGANSGLAVLDGSPSGIDFVRSDRAPQAGDLTSDIFVAFAKDAVSWAAKTGGNAPANLTTAQLKSIYECTTTNWQQIDPALPNATIKALLPQFASGTRTFFLRAIGNGVPVTPGPCVTTGPVENQGVDPVLNDPDVVFPYSVGHFVGQVYGGYATPTDAAGPLTVRTINGVAPITPGHLLSPTFTTTAYGRVLFEVVRQAEWTATDAHGTALRAIFGPAGWICRNGAGSVKSYGFLPLPTGPCGSTVHA
ncbi:PstS family phosphate ABC transporter substrate-binding protein [Kitasatospora sp. NPDC091207]|uniref:PstS family phosphate ABC transporter substrate-binding protein n=1 Tax=Kitasatospora sp. NPDC091207 TaxID=3364083 RepID=UPI0037F29ADF